MLVLSSLPFTCTRLVAVDVNATKRPSPDTLGPELSPSACRPAVPTLTRSVVPAARAAGTTGRASGSAAPTARIDRSGSGKRDLTRESPFDHLPPRWAEARLRRSRVAQQLIRRWKLLSVGAP